MNLSRCTHKLESQKVDVKKVVSCMIEIHQKPKGCHFGSCKMKQLLQKKIGILVHKMTVTLIHKTLDLFGITLYGFINSLCHKILLIYVNITNNDPNQIGNYYLQLFKSFGGSPRRTPSDQGTETIHVAGYQIKLIAQYKPKSTNPTKAHILAKSTHNQKIECLWSQLMKKINTILKTPCKSSTSFSMNMPHNINPPPSPSVHCSSTYGSTLTRILCFQAVAPKNYRKNYIQIELKNRQPCLRDRVINPSYDESWLSNPSNDPSLTISA
ncbi:hypothetical protein VP01_4650g1 [Puccinia sorghi]|uniref:Integrase core domain-containing protein n=1 Tax=Puccinia sorghi TaxID=27349 RepID=A0A0L6UQ86_9BASI|nr:hypothetical protein VP01_4650g1 [Puccinia sorghi]